jgi:hypothetical protein
MCQCQPETFFTLLSSGPHWLFELLLMVVFDGLIGAIAWPFVYKHIVHHLDRDKREKGAVVLGGNDPLLELFRQIDRGED